MDSKLVTILFTKVSTNVINIKMKPYRIAYKQNNPHTAFMYYKNSNEF